MVLPVNRVPAAAAGVARRVVSSTLQSGRSTKFPNKRSLSTTRPATAQFSAVEGHQQRSHSAIASVGQKRWASSVSADSRAVDLLSGAHVSDAADRWVRRTLLKVLETKEEVSAFVSKYNEVGARTGDRLIVIKVGGEVVEKELETLCSALFFLQKVGLRPVLIHGAGPQMNEELAKANVEPQYLGGMRVTDAATLTIARRVFLEANRRLVSAIEDFGCPARPIVGSVFLSDWKDQQSLGFVGEIRQVNVEQIRDAIEAGYIPVITSLGETSAGQVLNINADVAARELAVCLQPEKTVLINAKGGWVEDDGTKLAQIDMAKDFARMEARDYTGRQGTLLKLRELKMLVDQLPPEASVVLTSAGALHREILDSCSRGTVIMRGEQGAAESADHRPTATSAFSSSLSSSSQPESSSSFYSSSAAELERPFVCASPPRKKVGLLGARGYVGRELIRLIGQHPQLELVLASSRALEGQRVLDVATASPTNPHTDGGVHLFSSAPPAGLAGSWSSSAMFAGSENRGERQSGAAAAVAAALQIDEALRFCDLQPADIAKATAEGEVDVWVLALPNGLCQRFVPHMEGPSASNGGEGPLLIDLSADMRFDDSGEWVYGLPETKGNRQRIREARKIANPGCYATGAQLALLPLLDLQQQLQQGDEGLRLDPAFPPQVFGVSGYSGAGTGLSEKNDPSVLAHNFLPYSSVKHIHEREISRQLRAPVWFSPHVAPHFQGISLTVTAKLSAAAADAHNLRWASPGQRFFLSGGESTPSSSTSSLSSSHFPSADALREAYERYYAEERLVQVSSGVPQVRDLAGQHHVSLGGFQVDADRQRVVVVAALDNLMKGAATQALQNINIALGLPEYAGILPQTERALSAQSQPQQHQQQQQQRQRPMEQNAERRKERDAVAMQSA